MGNDREKIRRKQDGDRMSIGMVTCEFINNIISEIDERAKEAGKGREPQKEGRREKKVNRISVFKTACVRNPFPSHPSCVSF